jgi:hypothetical protein
MVGEVKYLEPEQEVILTRTKKAIALQGLTNHSLLCQNPLIFTKSYIVQNLNSICVQCYNNLHTPVDRTFQLKATSTFYTSSSTGVYAVIRGCRISFLFFK